MLQIKPLPEELQTFACKELGEIPERIPEDLQALKIWIQQQPHLHACTQDQFLIQFLRDSKYSLERTKERIDQFYRLRSKLPDLLSTHEVDKPVFQRFHNTK